MRRWTCGTVCRHAMMPKSRCVIRQCDHLVPEVNPDRIADYRHRGIIANPNCSTIQMVVALKPIYDAVGIQRINVATYQAVSGAGRAAVEDLARHSAAMLSGQPVKTKKDAKQIAFNEQTKGMINRQVILLHQAC